MSDHPPGAEHARTPAQAKAPSSNSSEQAVFKAVSDTPGAAGEIEMLRAELADLRILDRQRQAASVDVAQERDELRRRLTERPPWFARQLRRLAQLTYWTVTGRLRTRLVERYQAWRAAPLLAGPPETGPTKETAVQPIVPALLSGHFSMLQPIHAYHVEGIAPRLTLVTDSINAGSLFGGVATAIILAAELAKISNRKLRILTLTEAAAQENVSHVLRNAGIQYQHGVEFAFADPARRRGVDIGDLDTFISTSWWTTYACTRIAPPSRITYLLQEDERDFYAASDHRLRCEELFRNGELRFVINTKLLYDHLVSEGYDNIARNGVWFEPAFPADTYYRGASSAKKKNFFFYARPNNVRNLFYRGLEVIDQAGQQRILDPAQWSFHFVGKDLDPQLANLPYRPALAQNLSWSEYAALVRQMDLGLSLMYTPHPSYPPLDLAASGAVAVTNRYGRKQDLSHYSRNIICAAPDVDSMVQALADGAALACDEKQRATNYAESHMNRDWGAALQPVVTALSRQSCS